MKRTAYPYPSEHLLDRMDRALFAQDQGSATVPMALAVEWERDAARVWRDDVAANRVRMLAHAPGDAWARVLAHGARRLLRTAVIDHATETRVVGRIAFGAALIGHGTGYLDMVEAYLAGGGELRAAVAAHRAACPGGDASSFIAAWHDGLFFLANGLATKSTRFKLMCVDYAVYYLGMLLEPRACCDRPALHALLQDEALRLAPEAPDIKTLIGSGETIAWEEES